MSEAMSSRHPVVLHVDDDDANRYAVSRSLRRAGFEVIEAINGTGALEMAKQQPDVVVLDVRLPDIDGFEVCRRIKADPATSGIPVLHLSASFVTGDKKAEGLDAGADGYLVRPVEPIELVATVNALLRQRRTEEALRQSEARFRLMADSAPVLIWMADGSGLGAWFNRSWLEFVGRSIDDELGSGWRTHIHPDDRAAVDLYGSHFASRTPFALEYRLRRHDGEYRWMVDRGVPMFAGDDKAFSGYIGTCLDISDRRRSEAILADSEAKFRQLAEDRTRLLEFERSVRREAEEANRLKDEFLATLSHELRTPLNAIVGWTTILQQGEVSPVVLAEAVATIDRNARMQSQLIEDLLDVSRILSGKLRLDIQAFDLAPIVEAAIASVYPASAAKEIQLNRELITDGAVLLGDAGRLQQVVWNLLSNAVKFTPSGGRVDVSLKRRDSQIELRVEDTGQGIPEAFLPHVFDRFRQADASTTRAQTGLGLGLAIVRHLVEQHGGTVAAESAGENRGATFVVRLPIMAARSQPAANLPGVGGHAPMSRSDGSPLLLPELPGLRVLVVDDDPDSRTLLKRLLEQRHAVVQTAGSVPDALEHLSSSRFDVLVSDIGMPGQDGYELVRQMRLLPGDAALTPAVALTAFARADDRRRVLRAGFQSHVVKPVDPRELLAALLAASRSHSVPGPVKNL